MNKTILLTGATDGIGKVTATKLVQAGHTVMVHGRSEEKLATTMAALAALDGNAHGYLADLSDLQQVQRLAQQISEQHNQIDAIINNAGILKTPNPITADGLDIRFVVNTVAPYLLAKELLPKLGDNSRVVNISSAAQAPFTVTQLSSNQKLADMDAYAQSKLAIIMWGNSLANKQLSGPAYISVNPGSLLGSKMVKEGFGIDGKSLDIGADIICSAALDEEFSSASGKYYDNDSHQFANPHADALDMNKCDEVVRELESILQRILQA